MVRVIITSLVSLALLSQSVAQSHEIGINLGAGNLLGDFGGGPDQGTIFIKDIDWNQSQPTAGIYYRLNTNTRWSFKAGALYGNLTSTDDESQNQVRYDRGLSSKASMLDFALQVEFHFLQLEPCSRRSSISPYIGAGVGGMYYKPTISHRSGNAIGPTTLEGYGEVHSYVVDSAKQLYYNIPVTVGFKYNLKRNWVFGLDVSYRLTTIDDLDLYVNQENDHYFYGLLSIGYAFCGKGDKQYRCPDM